MASFHLNSDDNVYVSKLFMTLMNTNKDMDCTDGDRSRSRIKYLLDLFKTDDKSVFSDRLAALLVDNDIIDRVNISYMQLGDANVAKIAKALETNTKVTHLILIRNDITDEGMKSLATLLANNNTVRQLTLTGNKFTAEGVRSLTDAIKDRKLASPLKEFAIGHNNLGDDGFKHLHDLVMSGNISLERLFVDNSKVTNKSIQLLCYILTDNKTLKTLSVGHNYFTTEKFMVVVDVISNNTSLTQFEYYSEYGSGCSYGSDEQFMAIGKVLMRNYEALGNDPITNSDIRPNW